MSVLTTPFGFDWDTVIVERTVLLSNGIKVLTIRTQRKTLEVYVSATGLLRVFERGKGEWKR